LTPTFTLTDEQVTQLAPDAASLKAGKDLSRETKWLNFQANERSIWGEMQGSGSNPYRTQIDTAGMAFKCSCPSRKFPCKHGLGLLFLYAQKAADFKAPDEPAWVSEWMNKRTEKAATKAAEPADTTPDKADKAEKDKAKRDYERLLKVQNGAAELELWLKDLVRTGILSLPEKGNAFFEKTAARMIDAQAKGLANMVNKLSDLNYYNGTKWQQAALDQICDIFTLLEAFKNIENLPPAQQTDIRTMVGWNQSAKDLMDDSTAEMLQDEWLVAARITTQEDDITVQRNWLYGCNTQRWAFILNFAHKTQPMQTQFMAGLVLKANLLYFPSNMPFRAIVKAQAESRSDLKHTLAPLPNWAKANDSLAENHKQFFWTNDMPQFVGDLSLIPHQDHWFLRDSEGAFQAIDSTFPSQKILLLLAASGGKPLNLFVLRTTNGALPLGYIADGKYSLL
jgi:uncharacterized Zn finger protein